MKNNSLINRFQKKYFYSIDKQKFIQNIVFYFLILSIFFSCTYTLMLSTDLSIGDFPSYTNIFKFNLGGANEIHRYRVFVPFLARIINEIFNFLNLENIYNSLNNKYNIYDADIRLSFYIINFISTLITCKVIKSYLKPLKPNLIELVLIIGLFITSKGIIFINSHPLVDSFEIAFLSLACLQIQRGNYFNVILLQIFSWPIKETAMFYIFLLLIYFLFKDKNINQAKKYFIFCISIIFLIIASSTFELLFENLTKFQLNDLNNNESINVFVTANTHISYLINSLSNYPLKLILGCFHSIASNISPAIIALSIFGYLISSVDKKFLEIEEKYKYKNMLFLLVILLFAGLLSGSISGNGLGNRLIEGFITIMPFLLIGIRKINFKVS